MRDTRDAREWHEAIIRDLLVVVHVLAIFFENEQPCHWRLWSIEPQTGILEGGVIHAKSLLEQKGFVHRCYEVREQNAESGHAGSYFHSSFLDSK
jgi:hypothetical protein